MSSETLAEMTPIKIGAGIMGLLGMMCFGLMLSYTTGPSPAELADKKVKRMETGARLAQAEYMRDIQYETHSEHFGDFATVYGR